MNPEVPSRPLLAVAAALAALALPASAWAHANLVSTEPPNGAVLARSPAAVRIVYDDVIRAGPGIAAIRNGAGSVLAGRARVEGGRTLVLPLRRGLANGDYSVRWSIVSDDGHLESGVLAFGVGLGRPPPLAALSPQSTAPSAESLVSRWLFVAGVLAAVGIALFALVTAPRDEERVALVLSTAAALAAAGALEEAHRAGLSTRAGTAFGAGFVLALAVATIAAAATLERRALRPALALALGLAAVPAFAGHALDRGLSRVNVVADVLHVLGAAAWTGALLGLALVGGGSRRRTVGLAATGVLLLGATGIVRASFELLHLAQVWDTSYGRALLVKTGLLAAALVLGRLLRTSDRRRAAVELVLVACLAGAVSVLVLLRPGRNVAPRVPVSLAQGAGPFPAPPRPPADAVLAAREAGAFGVAVAAERTRVTVYVLAPSGGGQSGLELSIDGTRARPCGSGCYRVAAPPAPVVRVRADGVRADIAVPSRAPAAPGLLRRARARYRALSGVAYVERLASDPTHELETRWRLERPDRIEYAIAGGPAAVVIGARRWDRSTPKGRWQESAQTPLPQPATIWTSAASAHVLARTRRTITVSFVDPTIPAFFTVTFDRRTLLPRLLQMTASAHFMTDRYTSFNGPRAIRPPR